jgi:hypothetical protein
MVEKGFKHRLLHGEIIRETACDNGGRFFKPKFYKTKGCY